MINLGALHEKLINAARQVQPDERVPYAFEKRIMALIAERKSLVNKNLWMRWLWQAVVSCLVVAVVCGVFSLLAPSANDSGKTDLSQDFENTLLASVDQGDSLP